MAWPKGKAVPMEVRAKISKTRLERAAVARAQGPAVPAAAMTNASKYIEIGDTGLKRHSGKLNEEFLRELKGRQGIKTYKEMRENDAIIAAFMFAIEMLIRGVKWRIEPETQHDSADEEAKTFVEECLLDMSHTWDDAVCEVLSFLVYGWSWLEIVYKLRKGDTNDSKTRSRYTDGKIGWRKLPIRSQESFERWVFDDTGGVLGMVQRLPTSGESRILPIEKSLLFRTTSNKNSPEGRSVLRSAYRSWYFGKRIEEIEGIGIERDLAGLPVMGVPSKIMSSNASDSEKAIYAACKDIVTNIRRDEQEGIVMPLDMDENGNQAYDLKLLSTGGSRQFDTDKIIRRYDQKKAMQVLADFILLGHEKVGSFSLSSDKTEMFAVAIGAYLKMIADVMNRHAIPRLLAINAIKGRCNLCHADIETPNLTELGDYISKLAGAGMPMFPDEELENTLRAAADLPDVPEDRQLIDPVSTDPLYNEDGTLIDPMADPEADPTQTPVQPGATGAPKGQQAPPGTTSNPQGNVQQDALNGAQVTALLDILNQVATGQLPRDTGIQMIVSAFPIDLAQAEKIMGTLGNGFEPTKPDPVVPFGQPGAQGADGNQNPATPKPNPKNPANVQE